MTERARNLRRIVLLCTLGAALLWAGYCLRPVLNPFLAACLIAYVLKPVVDRLEAWRLPRWLAVLALYLALLGAVAACAVAVVPAVAARTRRELAALPDYADRGVKLLRQFLPPRYHRLLPDTSAAPQAGGTPRPSAAPPPALAPAVSASPAPGPAASPAPLEPVLSEENLQEIIAYIRKNLPDGMAVLEWLARNMAQGLTGLFGLVSLLVLIPVYAFFILLGMERTWQRTLAYLPGAHRARTVEVLTKIHLMASHFFRGKLVICLVKGLFTIAGFLWTGVPFGFVLGALSGLASFVPFLNLAVLLPALLLSLLGGGALTALGALLVYVLVEALEAGFLVPFYLGGEVSLHPVTLLLALFIGAEIFGFFGMLLAIPLACTLKILFFEFVEPQLKILAAQPPAAPPEAGR